MRLLIRSMFREDSPPEEAYERLRKTLCSLPEGVVSLSQIAEEFEHSYGGLFPDLNIPRAMQDLIILGEVELCRETESGARVWLHHRWGDLDPDDRIDEPLLVAGMTWKCYVAPNFRRRRAERLFTTRSAAFDHLKRAGGVAPEDLERVWFLNDVWATQLESGETAVVRREPVYERESSHGEYYEDTSDFGI
ncbi:hypothetical protein GL213_07605 [Halogeometricum borinquense]|uniref:Uncharacterized protein n=2 Tax=Halogeometricum borinquense TaxID=60847 RepID=A0A6C0UGJ9_9EURY|nr:hypothetical protein G3I44_10375 [Halogeometricum borinquense]QIQ76393.1 hypothetical protein GL213_07605 [Halogeometricum borinquense]